MSVAGDTKTGLTESDSKKEKSDPKTRLRKFFARPPIAGIPALDARSQMLRVSLVVVIILLSGFLLSISIVGAMQQRAAQQNAFDAFRAELAQGVAPTGPINQDNRVIRAGTPMAYLEIPSIGVRQVVFEGTSSSVMMNGPGHRMDTVFPGQAGTSIIMGRRAAFGGPFSRLVNIKVGDPIYIATGQGEFEYSVIAVRSEGDPVPPKIESGKSRIQLVTVGGRPYLPDGIFRVDAELNQNASASSGTVFTAKTLPASDRFMGVDFSNLWQLVLWLEALAIVIALMLWGWNRWGRLKTWIVIVPVLVLVGLAVSNQFARFLPNLL